jgi:hypothetical protein
VPSCMRVPPEAVLATTGMRSAVARSTARTSRSAAATPIVPARNENSQATTATRRPPRYASPVTTASSRPVRPRASASSAAYPASIRADRHRRVVPGPPAPRIDDAGDELPGPDRPLITHGRERRGARDPRCL